MAGDILVSGGKVTDDQGNPTALTIGATVTIEGTGNTLKTPHDALYRYAPEMQSNGTLVAADAADTGVPRWSLADAATQRVKWTWEIPVGWDSIAVRFGWCNESSNSGNVVFQFSYRHIYLGETNLNSGSVTTIAIPAAAALSQYVFNYFTGSATASVATPSGGFGDKPFMQCAITRLGSDGSDTLSGAAAVFVATATRVT